MGSNTHEEQKLWSRRRTVTVSEDEAKRNIQNMKGDQKREK